MEGSPSGTHSEISAETWRIADAIAHFRLIWWSRSDYTTAVAIQKVIGSLIASKGRLKSQDARYEDSSTHFDAWYVWYHYDMINDHEAVGPEVN